MKIPIMMLAASGLISCQNAPERPVASGRRAAAATETISHRTGQTFIISLGANHTTGYSWALDGKGDSTVVATVSNDYVSESHAPGVAGFGGTERWKFRAETKGTTVLHFIYRRPWEKDTKPAEERSFKVLVE